MSINQHREDLAVNKVFRSIDDKLFSLSMEIKTALCEAYELGYKDACIDDVKYIVESAIREIQKPSDENNKEEAES